MHCSWISKLKIDWYRRCAAFCTCTFLQQPFVEPAGTVDGADVDGFFLGVSASEALEQVGAEYLFELQRDHSGTDVNVESKS